MASCARNVYMTDMLKLLETTVQNLEKRYGPVETEEPINVSDAVSHITHDTFTQIIKLLIRDQPSKFYDPRLLKRGIEQIHPFAPSDEGELATQLLVTGTQNIFKAFSNLGKRNAHDSERRCDIEILKREVDYLTQLWKEVIDYAHRHIDVLECRSCHMIDSDELECDCEQQKA